MSPTIVQAAQQLPPSVAASMPWAYVALAVVAGMVIGSTAAKLVVKLLPKRGRAFTSAATAAIASALGFAATFGLGWADDGWGWYAAGICGAIGGASYGWLLPEFKELVSRFRKDKEVSK